MKILAELLTKFKGKIKVQADRVETDVSEDKGQVSITKNYILTDVDLSDEVSGIKDEDGTGEWLYEAEQQLDHFLRDLKKEFVRFETELSSHERHFQNDQNLLGVSAEISLGSFEKKADLSKMKVEIELVAFYDIPKVQIEFLMNEVVEALTSMDSKEFNSR
jgi:hypothetical protein